MTDSPEWSHKKTSELADLVQDSAMSSKSFSRLRCGKHVVDVCIDRGRKELAEASQRRQVSC